MGWFSKKSSRPTGQQTRFACTQRQPDGSTYDIYSASTRSVALAFLREHVIKEERRYAIVETREGNLGEDFIVIFDEKSQEPLELGERKGHYLNGASGRTSQLVLWTIGA